jgi:hypothetical protein
MQKREKVQYLLKVADTGQILGIYSSLHGAKDFLYRIIKPISPGENMIIVKITTIREVVESVKA